MKCPFEIVLVLGTFVHFPREGGVDVFVCLFCVAFASGSWSHIFVEKGAEIFSGRWKAKEVFVNENKCCKNCSMADGFRSGQPKVKVTWGSC